MNIKKQVYNNIRERNVIDKLQNYQKQMGIQEIDRRANSKEPLSDN